MKTLFFLALITIGANGFADESGIIYKCEYRIVQPNKPIFSMTGNILPDDAKVADNSTTYLTLAPNTLSGIALEARILFTSDGYNPITLHRPGQSVTTLASTTITLGEPGQLGYRDENGVSYSVMCNPR